MPLREAGVQKLALSQSREQQDPKRPELNIGNLLSSCCHQLITLNQDVAPRSGTLGSSSWLAREKVVAHDVCLLQMKSEELMAEKQPKAPCGSSGAAGGAVGEETQPKGTRSLEESATCTRSHLQRRRARAGRPGPGAEPLEELGPRK